MIWPDKIAKNDSIAYIQSNSTAHIAFPRTNKNFQNIKVSSFIMFLYFYLFYSVKLLLKFPASVPGKYTTLKIDACLTSLGVCSQTEKIFFLPFFSIFKGFASKRFSRNFQ